MIDLFKRMFGTQPDESDKDHVASFNEQQAEEEDVEFIDHGEQTVLLEKITGSVGKYHDFDSRFRPKKHVSGKRFGDIKRTMREGGSLPPERVQASATLVIVADKSSFPSDGRSVAIRFPVLYAKTVTKR